MSSGDRLLVVEMVPVPGQPDAGIAMLEMAMMMFGGEGTISSRIATSSPSADLGAAPADWIGWGGGEENRLTEGGWDGEVSEKSLEFRIRSEINTPPQTSHLVMHFFFAFFLAISAVWAQSPTSSRPPVVLIDGYHLFCDSSFSTSTGDFGNLEQYLRAEGVQVYFFGTCSIPGKPRIEKESCGARRARRCGLPRQGHRD